MKTFNDTLEFIQFLNEKGIKHGIDSEFQAESFCKNNPTLNLYYQDPEYLIRGAPKFVADLKPNKTLTAEFTSHKFVDGKKVDTITEVVKFKTSIPKTNEFISAFEEAAWRAFWSLHGSNWYKNHPGYCSLSLKIKP